jgi:LacI family transcriptional regulator
VSALVRRITVDDASKALLWVKGSGGDLGTLTPPAPRCRDFSLSGAVYLCNSDSDSSRQADYLALLAEQRVRGILITPVDQDTSDIDPLVRRGIPVVLVDRAGGHEWCSVGVDDVEGGALAVTHLLECGHRRLAFVGGPMSTVQVADRLRGARNALEAAGRPPEDLAVLGTDALNVAEGRRAGERLLGVPRTRRPTAAFCANDLLALGLLQQMTRVGVNVPDDLAIVGYDDIEFAGAAAVPLSSVRQPRQLLGHTAAELLLAESERSERHVHQQVLFHPELVVRTSSATHSAPASAPARSGASGARRAQRSR